MQKLQYRKSAPCALAILAALTAIILSGSAAMQAQSAAKQIPIPLPPMGWSSWNSFSNTVNSQNTQEQAKAMISTGMSKVGYQYINIDEGWWLGQRHEDGSFVVDPNAWPALAPGEKPSDMSNIVRYIHGLGLKAGIYTDAGESGCSMFPDLGPVYMHTGSAGHYEQDFLQFAKWGFDYVKVDWCGGDKDNLSAAVQYAEIARAIALAEAKTGHHLFYSICNWGKQSPWTWAPNVGGVAADIWRTSGDIVAPIVANSKNADRKASFPGMLSNFDQGIHPEAEHTGFYNDPDMMVIGMPGLTDTQNRVHFSLWAISGAPLLVGADLTTLSEATRATLTNPEVIAVDQDALGLQSVKVAESGAGLEVWSKPLSKPGERAVLLLNRTTEAKPISFLPHDLGLLDSSPARVRDPWARKDLDTITGSYFASVPAGDAVLLIVRGAEPKPTAYKPASGVQLKANHPVEFIHVSSAAHFARVQITYTNPDKATRFVELRVNGGTATRVAFPPTGGANAAGTVTVLSPLDKTGANSAKTGADNALSFSVSCDSGLGIESIAVE